MPHARIARVSKLLGEIFDDIIEEIKDGFRNFNWPL